MICDKIEEGLAEANAKSGNANAEDDYVLFTWSWIMNEQYCYEYECANTVTLVQITMLLKYECAKAVQSR